MNVTKNVQTFVQSWQNDDIECQPRDYEDTTIDSAKKPSNASISKMKNKLAFVIHL